MIKPAIINISRQPDGILDLKKGFDKTLENIPTVSKGFSEDCLEMYESRADHLSNNFRLNETSILIFLQFYSKINGN